MAGAVTLTGLIPTIYNSMNTVARELVGFIPAVSRDSGAERAAVNQTVTSPVVGAMAAENLVAGAYADLAPDQTINYVNMTIQKARSVPFSITGEEARSVAGSLGTIDEQRIAQAIRTLTNEIEVDLAALHTSASRAYGTYNVTPFGTANDLSDFAQARRVMDDNGAPQADFHMVLGSAAAANIRGKQSGLLHVNEAGSDALLRRGALGSVQDFDLHISNGVKTAVTVGTGSSATTDTTGYAIGSTTITLASAGTGTIIAGDIITFANDTNKYVVKTGDTDVSNAGTIVLQEPGLRQALPASAVAITVIAATTRNMFFQRSAIQLATRAPAMPPGGDSADDIMMIQDPHSGIVYEFAVYRQKRVLRYEVNLCWGVAMTQPRYCGLLIGA